MGLDLIDPVTPTDDEARLAKESARALASVPTEGPTIRVYVGDQQTSVEMPVVGLHMLRAVMACLGEGKTVRVVPTRRELTTQDLADLLNVSRPYAISLLDRGQIPHRKVGKHRRVTLEDALTYKRAQDQKSAAILDALAAEAQADGEYD